MTSPFSRPALDLQFEGFIKTPPLWKDDSYFDFPQFPMREPLPPQNLADKLLVPKIPLGKRVEYFFKYYIENFSNKKLFASNQVIRAGKITIGELDFLLGNKETGDLIHVELVYKFYLYDPDLEKEEDRWIGPNRKDNLKRKLYRLKHHQFPLLFRKETQQLLQQLKAPLEKIHQEVCFKAMLFVPLSLRQHPLPKINQECLCGYWIRETEFIKEIYGSHRFFTPSKEDWPIAPETCRTWYSFEEILEQVSPLLSSQRSPLVWMKSNNSDYTRFFIVWW